MLSKIKYTNTNECLFFATTRQRVDNYFKENAISKYANRAMWIKTFFFLTGYILFYLLIMFNQFHVWIMVAFAAFLGAFGAFIGFNICHDAIHGAYSKHQQVNRIFSILFNFIGANPYVWGISHNIVHHAFTNIPGHDEDIEIVPGLIRISEAERVDKIQRYQHLYTFILYGFTSLNWVLRKDFRKFFKKNIGHRPNINHPRKEYFNLFFYKALYYFMFIGLPLLVLHITWWQLVIGFVTMHLVQGLVLSLVFQLAHVVEGTAFPFPNAQGNIEDTWAQHQMRTTSNFANQSALMNFICGGLNFQIEHHLFPKICHIHYPNISLIVKQTAHEFNLPYIENQSLFSALQSHYRVLRRLGKEAYIKKTSAA